MNLRKTFMRVFAIVLLTICISTTFAPRQNVYAVDNANSQEVILAEETEWKYRTVDGRLQKRLWSITYNMWLTEWEWV